MVQKAKVGRVEISPRVEVNPIQHHPNRTREIGVKMEHGHPRGVRLPMKPVETLGTLGALEAA